MAQITEERILIQQEETKFRAAVSESTLSRVGATTNFINLRQFDTIDFKVNGRYNRGPIPNLQFDGIVSFPFPFEVVYAMIYTGPTVATGGITELDLKWKPYASGAYASIFSTTPKFDQNAAASDAIYNGSTKTGFVAPVLSKTQFDAWDLIRFDILSSVAGPQEGCGLKLFWRPR